MRCPPLRHRSQGSTIELTESRAIADASGPADEPARLYELLASASGALLHAESVDGVLHGVCEVAVRPDRFALAWIGLRSGPNLRPVAACGPVARAFERDEIEPTGGPAFRCLQTGQTVMVSDIRSETAFMFREEALHQGLLSLCAVPLQRGHDTIGVLVVYGRAPDVFDELAARVLEALAADVVFALDTLAHREAEAVALEEARRADAQRAALLRHNRDVVAILEWDGRVRWISDGITRLTGHPPEFYVGDVALGVHPDDVERVVEAWSTPDPGGDIVSVMRLAHREGGWRWCEVRVSNQLDDPLIGGLLVNFHDITEQKAADDALRFHSEVLAAVADAVVATDAKGRVTYLNQVALELSGWSAESAIGAPVTELFPFAHQEDVLPDVYRALSEGQPWTGELTYRLARGEVPMLVTSAPIYHDGDLVGSIGVATDISERVAAEARLAARARMQAEVARLGQLALRSSGTGSVSSALAAAIGTTLEVDAVMVIDASDPAQLLVRATWGDATSPSGTPPRSQGRLDLDALGITPGTPVLVEDFATDPRFGAGRGPRPGAVHRSGAIVAVAGRRSLYGSLVVLSHERRAFDADEVSFLEALANVLAAALDRERSERELVNLSLIDALTGLPNRILLADRTSQALAAGEAWDHRVVGVLIVDIDRFKEFNDAYDHETGDRLLLTVADRLRSAIGPDDTLARLGSDEFAVLCPSLSSIDDLTDRAAALAAVLEPPVHLDHVELFVTASIGIAVRDRPEASSDAILREADAAMHRAKERGRNRYELYDDRMRERAIRRLDTASALRRALQRDELRVLWQPEVSLGFGSVTSRDLWAEALVRWQHPERGLLGPGEFIGLAEETGLIVDIGEVVVDAAFRQLAEWDRSGAPGPQRISVNLSPRQLGQDSLVPMLTGALATHGVAASSVILEITEDAVMTRPDRAVARLGELHDIGFQMAIDDFGTGYSSLGYLRRLPVSVLKIDRVFISGLTVHRHDWSIVKGTIELAHALALQVVAEGVETDEQRHQLVGLGCDRGQGFLWSPPVTADELRSFVAALDEA